MSRLAGRRVLVTGASSGFGAAIARLCAQEGADVALVARRVERLEALAQEVRGQGRQAVICPCDVQDPGQVQAAVEQTRAALGGIDVLVNNAGTNLSHRSIQETTLEEWHRLLEVNLTSAFHFTRLVMPEMVARGQGTIVNIASRAANYPSLLAGVGYSASKLGMQALNRITNEEGNPHNVRACVINPGVANTPILDHRPRPPSPAARRAMLQPEDIAEAVIFVASLPSRVLVERLDIYPTRVDVS